MTTEIKNKEIETFFRNFVGNNEWEDFFQDKIILDAGCGSGEYIKKLCDRLGQTRFKVVGIDINGDNVNIAREVNKENHNVFILQGDITEHPFKERVFDVIYSTGVIHYTSIPENTFAGLTKLLKDNGKMGIWVYPTKGAILDKLQTFLRFFTTRLPSRLLYCLCFLMAPLLFFFRTHSGRNLMNSSWRECADTIFAFYGPKYLQFNSPDSVLRWFQKAGFRDKELMAESISVKGVK